MHTRLLNIGFIKQPDGSYFNNELRIRVTVVGPTTIAVDLPSGPHTTSIADLEEAILGDGFGEFRP
jgi:hypothetical protein